MSRQLVADLETAHRRGVGAASAGLRDARLERLRLEGDAVDVLADAAVSSATPFLRAPLLGRLADVARLHPPRGASCPSCGVPVPCPTAEVLW